jgi:hypothetical protein
MLAFGKSAGAPAAVGSTVGSGACVYGAAYLAGIVEVAGTLVLVGVGWSGKRHDLIAAAGRTTHTNSAMSTDLADELVVLRLRRLLRLLMLGPVPRGVTSARVTAPMTCVHRRVRPERFRPGTRTHD